jgi:hypothetical protein
LESKYDKAQVVLLEKWFSNSLFCGRILRPAMDWAALVVDALHAAGAACRHKDMV